MKKEQAIRFPLFRVFGFALITIIALFLLISWLTFSKVLQFESRLTQISEQALPKIVISTELFNEATHLLNFIDVLAEANSDAAKRLAEQELNAYVRAVKNLASSKIKDEFLNKQLEIINLELLEFSDLIWQHASITEQLNTQRQKMYSDFESVLERSDPSSTDAGLYQAITELMLKIDRAMNSNRLQEVRQLFSQIKVKINALSIIANTSKQGARYQQFIAQTQTLMFANNGLEQLAVAQLKLRGRVRGRENFMRQLIENFSNLLDITAQEHKNQIFNQVSTSVREANQQVKVLGAIIIVAILLMVGLLIFVQQRILKRLALFNSMVKSKSQGIEYQHILKGNDEITDMADAFEQFAHTINSQKQELQQMTMTDGLTQIPNRRALDARLQHDIELSVRQKSSVSVVIMDIDFFKPYNDNYGHAAGDECLKQVAKCLSEVLQRKSDFVARYGGEEFVAILPNTSQAGAIEIVKDIFNAIYQLNIPHEYSQITDKITLSMGIATSTPDSILIPDTILKKADDALYLAKKSGKNTYKLG